jgi:hypothetical protein
MTAEAVVATAFELAVKVAEDAPGAIVTEVGTVATAVLLLDNNTVMPAPGAGPLRVIVPVLVAPPATAAGFIPIEANTTGLTVKAAVLVVFRYTAEIVMLVAAVTDLLLKLKVAVVAPAATVAEAGTLAMLILLLDRVTIAPPAGAGAVRVMVPALVCPPTRDAGFIETIESVGAG